MAFEGSLELRSKISELVRVGQAKALPPGQTPDDFSVSELFASNLAAGRRIMDGMKLYRGSKDPQVDSGTFDVSYKHTTPLVGVARGYSQSINDHIGVNPEKTKAIGMFAEYELPEDARFYQNFGIERGDQNAMTRAEAESRLEPLVEAYAAAATPLEKEEADRQIRNFCEMHLYEIPVPAEQKPVRQFVTFVDPHDFDQPLKFVEHQDRGPLADVVIDVVKERKSAIDEYSADSLVRQLSAMKVDGVDQLMPGAGRAVQVTMERVKETLDALREEVRVETAGIDSVSQALAWRGEKQKDVSLTQLTNDGVSIKHGDLRLAVVNELLAARHTMEVAGLLQQELPAHQAFAEKVAELSTMFEERNALKQSIGDLEKKAGEMQTGLSESEKVLEKYKAQMRKQDDEHRHASRNVLSKLVYKLSGNEKKALEAMVHTRMVVATRQGKLDAGLTELDSVRGDLRQETELLEKVAVDIEKGIDEANAMPARTEKLHWGSDFAEVARTATAGVAAREEKIEKGKTAAQLFMNVERLGLDLGAAHYVASKGLENESAGLVTKLTQQGKTMVELDGAFSGKVVGSDEKFVAVEVNGRTGETCLLPKADVGERREGELVEGRVSGGRAEVVERRQSVGMER